MLVVRRQRQLLAEALERLVDGEAGPCRRDLEEDAAGLAEVDRLEVEAVDDRSRACARRRHALVPGLVLLRRRCPRDVVDRAGDRIRRLAGRLVVRVEGAPPVSARLPLAVAARLERERLLEEP